MHIWLGFMGSKNTQEPPLDGREGKEACRMEESDVECRDGWDVIRLDLEVRWDRRGVRLQMELLGGVEGEEGTALGRGIPCSSLPGVGLEREG